MPTVTRLVQGKKNPNRVNLYLDGEFAFALSIDEVARHSLKKGLELTPEKIQLLKDADFEDKVYAKVLNFLSFRPHSVKEVRDRLYKYEVKDKLLQDKVIGRLLEKGYLDDLSFARWFVESRNTHRPRSARQLSAELGRKGISREIIAKVTPEFAGDEETIMALLDKRLGARRQLEKAEKQQIYGFLARRGFAWEKLSKVVKTWESE